MSTAAGEPMQETRELSGGCIDVLIAHSKPENKDEALWSQEYFLQILSIKQIPTQKDSERYRIIISDGLKFTQAMLAMQLNGLVKDNSIGKNTVIKVDRLSCSEVQGRFVFIILSMTPIGVCEKIGDPQSAPGDGQQAAQQAASSSSNVSPSTSTTIASPRTSSSGPKKVTPAAPTRAVYPIEGLSPYNTKWTIKALCTQKSDVRTWSKPTGEGKVFSVTFADESAEIRATAWNQHVDQFFDVLQEGKVYYVSKGKINLAKKKFNNVQNDYELSIDHNTVIEECLEQGSAPTIKYNFIALSELEALQKDATCDVLVVVKETGELGEITAKATNKQIPKRELTVVDRSGFSVRLTLWGKQAEQYNETGQPVIAFKNVKVGDFGGRTLSMSSSSSMQISPDIPDAYALRGWFDGVGTNENFTAHHSTFTGGAGFNRSELVNLEQLKDLGTSDKADFFSTCGTITHIKQDNLAYPGCQTESCGKKVVQVGEGWRCEKCDKSWSNPSYRYMISMSVADYTGQAWLTGFNDVGEVVLGMKADELIDLRDRDEPKFTEAVQKATSKTYNFSCKARQDTFNDTTRVRYSISKIMPLDYKEEVAYLIEKLKTSFPSVH